MPNIDSVLTTEYIELHELLKLIGMVDSGGAGRAIAVDSMVTVDGQPGLHRTAKIRAGQVVMLGGVRIAVQGPD